MEYKYVTNPIVIFYFITWNTTAMDYFEMCEEAGGNIGTPVFI
jgi:hypothetical protein